MVRELQMVVNIGAQRNRTMQQLHPATAGERRRGVSDDTDKCPKCGKQLIWCENCFPVFAYCSDTEYCCYETQTKHMEPELVLPPAMLLKTSL